MKKVEKVSIAEISFTLDSDAYIALKQYIDSLHVYYDKDPDGREIIADIEARIAELILNEQVYTKVVPRSLIDTIIAQLGTPEEIDDEVGEGEGASEAGSFGSAGYSGMAGVAGGSTGEGSIPRRLHRSSEGRILGGVCSGIAKYLDISVAWVRLILLFPILIIMIAEPMHWHWLDRLGEGWISVFFVLYIVLWIALPMARTPRQKLEARGEKITPSSIRQTMQGAASTPAGKKAASIGAELFTVLGRVVLFFVKFVMAIIGFSLLFACMIIFMCMVALIFRPENIVVMADMNLLSVLDGMAILSPVLFVVLWLLCVILPLFVIGMALLSFTFSWKLGRMFYGVTLGTWGLAMIFFGIVAAGNVRFFHDELPDRVKHLERHIDNSHEDGEWSESEWHEGEWQGDPGRVKVRRIDPERMADSLGGADVNVDADSDSLVIVVKRDGTPNDTINISK